jgi:hypothetical protein
MERKNGLNKSPIDMQASKPASTVQNSFPLSPSHRLEPFRERGLGLGNDPAVLGAEA